MEPEQLMAARIRESYVNVLVFRVLLTAWAIACWWISLSFLSAAAFGGVDAWILPVVMSIVGFVTAYVTAISLVGIDRLVRETQMLTKAIIERSGGIAAGTKERSLVLKPAWPVQAIMWTFGLHASLAALASFGWLAMAFMMMS